MTQPTALVLTGFGINCETETAHAFERAGAKAVLIHVNDLLADPAPLDAAQIFAVPGGFSFGDDVASGKILANRLRFKLGEPLKRFVDDGKLVIGICNGFQVLVKMGILPLFDGEFRQEVTLTHNDRGRFDNRWVTLEADPASVCVWTRGMERLEAPIRHGEGKFIPKDDAVLQRLQQQGQVVFRYARPEGGAAAGEWPLNPNGSIDDIAGICDPSGRVFGFMPHPEAFVDGTQHPRWTRKPVSEEGGGLSIFRNAVSEVEAGFSV